jgi:RNA polymerase sigma-70 factor (ECF subfamily)
MHTTPVSLLQRLRQPSDADAWDRFVQLYTPLLAFWAARAGVPDSDAADLIQDVLVLLLQKLPQFSYDPHKSFRSWLRTVTLNKWRERCRHVDLPVAATLALDDVAVADPAEEFWEAEYRQHLIGQALRLMQANFTTATWQACWQTTVNGKSAPVVAAELGMTPGAVRVARLVDDDGAGLVVLDLDLACRWVTLGWYTLPASPN